MTRKTERQQWSCNTEPIWVELKVHHLPFLLTYIGRPSVTVAMFLLLPGAEIIKF